MPTQTSFIECVPGQWVQICEYRESRKSLMVQLLGGAAILGYRTNSPVVANSFGDMVAGLWHSMEFGAGPAIFRINRELDGDCVTQAWFAWLVNINVTAETFESAGGGTTTAPANAVTATIECVAGGGGGTGGIHGIGLVGGGGGGGGGSYATTSLSVNPGDTLTYHVGAGGISFTSDAEDSWMSNTGVAPLSVSEGCLAAFGKYSGNSIFGGAGGLVADCIADSAMAGGSGGRGRNPVPGGGGGGGGGGYDVGSAIVQATNGQDATVFPPQIPVDGGAFGGGMGGSSVSPASPDGTDGTGSGGGGGGDAWNGSTAGGNPGNGSDGWIRVSFSVGVIQPTPVITVIDTFDEAKPPEDDAKINVNLPRLSKGAVKALHKLLSKFTEPKGKPDATQD